jgi:hypothetical protein
MQPNSATEIALAFWRAIDIADFGAAAALMSPDVVVDWPLSNERMLGPDNWKQVNVHYPGRWRASVESIVADGDTVVTMTHVSDGGIRVVAISFFTMDGNRIARLMEYWPETYPAPAWRSPWVVPIDAAGEVGR